MQLQCISGGTHPPRKQSSLQDVPQARQSVAVLLCTPPCFEPPRGGIFDRYKPMSDTVFTTPNGDARLARLWEDLLADPVPPQPAATGRRVVAARFERNDGRPLPPAHWRGPDTAPAIRLRARSSVGGEAGTGATTVLQQAEWRRPIFVSQDEGAKRVSRSWRVDLATWLRNLVELEDADSARPAAGEANSEDAFLSIPSPFRWEPKRTGIRLPFRSGPPFSKATDPRRFAPRRPKIPVRPLHKQPFYKRFFFYLRRWLSSSVWEESDPAA